MLYRTGDTRSRDIVEAFGSTVFGVLSLAVLALDLVTFAAQERPPAGQSVPLYRGGVEVVNVAALSIAPARRIGAVAAACGVSRHTLVRACLQCGAGSARDLRDAALHRRMHALMTAVPPKSIKEISGGLGFATPRSFARWLKRADGVVPRSLRGELCRRLTAPDDSGRGVEAGTLPTHARGGTRHG